MVANMKLDLTLNLKDQLLPELKPKSFLIMNKLIPNNGKKDNGS